MQYAEKENKYIGKVTRGLMTARAVETIREGIKLGDWVTVKEYTGSTTGEKRTVSGQVIYKNQHYFTLQGRHYREAFSFINIALGQAEIC